ncbi:MAG: hypothetical protein WBW93_17625 [Steroidobacteraceae bacterium]
MLGAHGAGGLHRAAHVKVLEELLDLEVNARRPSDVRAGAHDPIA